MDNATIGAILFPIWVVVVIPAAIYASVLISKWVHRQEKKATPAEPTDEQVSRACLAYRHDYGLMSHYDRKRLQFQAKEWLLAWRKTLDDNL